MRPGTLAFVAAAIVVMVVTVLAAFVMVNPTGPTATRAPSGSRPGSPGQSAAGFLTPDISVYQGPPIAEGITPTAHKAQSKVFHHDGSWWAVMADPVTSAFTVHRLDWETQHWVNTGTFVDNRTTADPDVLWDGEHLVVASAIDGGGRDSAARVSRYHYLAAENRFEIDADFPVEVTEGGVEAVVVARDGTGRLWVAYTESGHVFVKYAEPPADAVWHEAASPPGRASIVAPDDIAALVPVGSGMGVVWSNQLANAVYFAVAQLEGASVSWSPVETAITGMLLADDHLNVKRVGDGRVLVAMKTSQDELDTRNSQAPLTMLLERRSGGSWESHLFGRVEDRHTRPIVLVDDASGIVYVIATAPGTGGTIYGKWSPLDRIAFPTGEGYPLIEGVGGTVFADPTSTKQGIDTTAGFVVLAHEHTANRYVHIVVGGADHPAANLPAPSVLPPRAAVVINDAFESWPVGEPVPNGWSLRRTDVGTMTITGEGRHGRGVQLLPGADDTDVRACKSFGHTNSGRISATVTARVEAVGDQDAVLLAVRGSGDAASVRFGQGGGFVWYDGGAKVRSEIPFVPGRWYRVAVTVALAGQTYDLEIRDEADRVVASAAGLEWRTADPGEIEAVCVQSSRGASGGVRFDDVRVELLP